MNIVSKKALILLAASLPLVASEPLKDFKIVTYVPTQNQVSVANTPLAEFKNVLKKGTGTINVHGTEYRVYSSLPAELAQTTAPITLYSGGYSNGCNPAGYSGGSALFHGTIQGPLVTFSYPADASMRDFNFCQEKDLQDLNAVYQKLVSINGQSDVILMGGCKGATNSLRFLAESAAMNVQNMQRIKAVVVESPAISVYHALKNQWFGKFSHALLPYLFGNYKPNTAKTIMDATSFPAIPVLLGSLPADTVSELQDMKAMCSHLTAQGATVEHFVAPNAAHIIHGKIRTSKDWQEKVGQFLKLKQLRP